MAETSEKRQTKAELLDSLSVAQLKELASENEVELEGSVKADHVDQLASSRKITRASVEEYIGGDDADATDEVDDTESDPATQDSSAVDTAASTDTSTSNTTPPASEADDASPTGGENVAGTSQKTLSAAPPMADPSGSNIPYPNLRQPLADGADPAAGAASTTSESLDPALTDPDKAAVERVEGRTSDASLRSADGPHIDDVPPDITDGVKPSDGGPERYPFSQGGDVDIATVPDGHQEGEYYPNLEIDDTVVLGEHELVPDRLVGRRAFILDAPRYLVPMDQKDNVWITVRTRDEVNATLHIPLAAVAEVVKGGSGPTVRG